MQIGSIDSRDLFVAGAGVEGTGSVYLSYFCSTLSLVWIIKVREFHNSFRMSAYEKVKAELSILNIYGRENGIMSESDRENY